MAGPASDNAGNAPYADGWQNGDNGGTGFGPWDLVAGHFEFDPDAAAFPDRQFIDTPPPLAANNLRAPAFGLAVGSGSFFGSFTAATRPFGAPLGIGAAFSMQFDNPLLDSPDFNGQDNIIRFLNSSGTSVLGIYGSNFYNDNEWNITDAGPEIDTGITDVATADGSSLTLKKTGASTAVLVLDGVPFNVNLMDDGVIAGVQVQFGDTIASGGDGSREFFLNNLNIVPEPASAAMMLLSSLPSSASPRGGRSKCCAIGNGK